MSLRLRTGSLPVDPARDSDGGAFGGLCWHGTLLATGDSAGDLAALLLTAGPCSDRGQVSAAVAHAADIQVRFKSRLA